MSSHQVKFYRIKNGNGFWEPTVRMRHLGFSSVACGPDGPAARAQAETWNARWEEERLKLKAERSAGPSYLSDRDQKAGYVYFARVGGRVKIGYSKNPFTRIGAMKTGIPARIVALVAASGSKADERRIHQRLSAYRQSGEWFTASAVVLREMHRVCAFGVSDLQGADGHKTATTDACLSEHPGIFVGTSGSEREKFQ